MKKLTQEEFIDRAKKVHGDKYDYSLVEYNGKRIKVKIICPVHGIFIQRPQSHLSGQGCPKCKNISTGDRSRKTTEDFIKQAREIHGNKYDYSLVEYKNNKTKIKIICPDHGVFEQKPQSHLHGQGCPKCKNIKTSIRSRKTTKDFIKKAKEIHKDNKYDYSLVEYKTSKTKVKIICPDHGVFEQTPHEHLSGRGCPRCVGQNKTTEDFIKQAREIHGNKYDYSLVEYKTSKTKVKIICPIHGTFKQTPHAHLGDHGCPKCNESCLEKNISTILQKENIDNISQKTFDWLLYEDKMRLDFYIPRYNAVIECQGIQHFEPRKLFGGIEGYNKTIDRDKKKRELCEQHGIKVFYYANYKYKFPYKVYTNPEELIKDITKIDPT